MDLRGRYDASSPVPRGAGRCLRGSYRLWGGTFRAGMAGVLFLAGWALMAGLCQHQGRLPGRVQVLAVSSNADHVARMAAFGDLRRVGRNDDGKWGIGHDAYPPTSSPRTASRQW